MTTELDLAVVLTTFQRPTNLRRSLASLALQRGMDGRFEVIVADDGSQDETPEIVASFARSVDFPVQFTTHPHDGFCPARSRNDGVRASRARYILLADGDCVFPPNHLERHLKAGRQGFARAGWCYRLDQQSTARLDEQGIAAEAYRRMVTHRQRHRMTRRWLSELLYHAIRHPFKPKLTSWNIGITRHDYELVNGFDESYVGWGCEDDDLAMRLRRAGVQVRTVLGYTHAYHLWHPLDPTHPGAWNKGVNVTRLCDATRPVRCRHGLVRLDEVESSVSKDAA